MDIAQNGRQPWSILRAKLKSSKTALAMAPLLPLIHEAS
jgi:hypothetical protein